MNVMSCKVRQCSSDVKQILQIAVDDYVMFIFILLYLFIYFIFILFYRNK